VEDERTFHNLADATLNGIESGCSALEDIVDGLDISSSMGVLTIKLGEKGTYVLNKQTPNRQIWWSSPLSGPRRYQWDVSTSTWVSTRDGNVMTHTLVQR
jgi:frataxin